MIKTWQSSVCFGFRTSVFGFVSDFVLRISDFTHATGKPPGGANPAFGLPTPPRPRGRRGRGPGRAPGPPPSGRLPLSVRLPGPPGQPRGGTAQGGLPGGRAGAAAGDRLEVRVAAGAAAAARA